MSNLISAVNDAIKKLGEQIVSLREEVVEQGVSIGSVLTFTQVHFQSIF